MPKASDIAQEAPILMDCCRVAEHLPVDAIALELGRPAPPKRGALLLHGDTLDRLLHQDAVRGQAFVYANGCVVTADVEPQHTQALLMVLTRSIPNADFARMMLMREMRTVPPHALGAQARALSSSVVLDALERKADKLLDRAEQGLLHPRRFGPSRHARKQRFLAQVIAFRYECVHGQGLLDRPDTQWDLSRQAAYRNLASALRLQERTALLSHKTDQLENLLMRAHDAGHTGGMLRQLWLEVWMLLLFPIARLFEFVHQNTIGFGWLQQWLRSLHLL